MFGLDAHLPIVGLEDIVWGFGLGSLVGIDTHYLRTNLHFRLLPRSVADVGLVHQMVPLASSNAVIFMRQLVVAGETLLHKVSIIVGTRITQGSEIEVLCLRIIHLVEVCHRLDGEQDELMIGITCRSWHLLPQTIGIGFERLVLKHGLLPFPALQVVGPPIQELGGDAAVVAEVGLQEAGRLLGKVKRG